MIIEIDKHRNKEETMNQRRLLLDTFKALSDDTRLKLFGIVCQQETNAGDLASRLGVSESTVSHHLTKLREVNLVNLRAVGTERHYRANPGAIKRFKNLVTDIERQIAPEEAEESDDSWINELDVDDEARKVLRNYTDNGYITQLPRSQVKLLIILDWLATKFERDVKYTEREVNDIVLKHHEDYASIRRDLVDFGYLRRERGGGKYWVAPENDNE
jgi:predicted transcriptional regulator